MKSKEYKSNLAAGNLQISHNFMLYEQYALKFNTNSQ